MRLSLKLWTTTVTLLSQHVRRSCVVSRTNTNCNTPNRFINTRIAPIKKDAVCCCTLRFSSCADELRCANCKAPISVSFNHGRGNTTHMQISVTHLLAFALLRLGNCMANRTDRKTRNGKELANLLRNKLYRGLEYRLWATASSEICWLFALDNYLEAHKLRG